MYNISVPYTTTVQHLCSKIVYCVTMILNMSTNSQLYKEFIKNSSVHIHSIRFNIYPGFHDIDEQAPGTHVMFYVEINQ